MTGYRVKTSKVYDGTTSTTITGAQLSGIDNDHPNVRVSASASFASANVDTGITITLRFRITGGDVNYYQLPDEYVYLTNGEITPKPLELGRDPQYIQTKVYDGTTSVIVTGDPELDGVEEIDNVDVVTTMYYMDPNKGTNKTIIATFELSGDGASNYEAPISRDYPGSITRKQLNVVNTNVIPSKVYDGSDYCGFLNPGDFSQPIYYLDELRLVSTAKYADKNVGTGIPVTVNYRLDGSSSDNYSLSDSIVRRTANITAKQLTGLANITFSKPFDGGVVASSSKLSLKGVVPGETVDAYTVANYDNPAVGTGKTITTQFFLTGADLRNYLAPVDSILNIGEITSRNTTITGSQVFPNKEYDGTDSAYVPVAGVLGDTVAGSNVTVIAVAHYEDKNAGSGKTITIYYYLEGPDAGNYNAPTPVIYSEEGEITPKRVAVATPAVIAPSKVYDGTFNAVVSSNAQLNPNEIILDDDVNIYSTAQYIKKTVGENILVNVVNKLVGVKAGNYLIDTAAIAYSNITPLRLTINKPVVKDTKEYDGNTTTEVITVGQLTNLVAPDDVTVSADAVYDNPSVSNSKDVYVSYRINGTDANNYLAPANDTVHNKSITQKKATVSGTTVQGSKEYDGTPSSIVTNNGSVSNAGSDNVSVVATAIYSDENVGTGKTVTVTFTLEGPDAGNYAQPDPITLTADITKKFISIGTPATVEASKVYDGTRTCRVTDNGTPKDVLPGDTVSFDAVAEFNDSTAAHNKSVTVTYTLTGYDAENYALTIAKSYTTSSIDKLQLSVAYTDIAEKKSYDGTVDAIVRNPGELQGVLYMDSLVTLRTSAKYNTPAVGDNKPITIYYTLEGKGKDNYIPPVAHDVYGEIEPKSTYVTGTVASEDGKYYDGTTLATPYIIDPGTLNGNVDGADVRVVVDTAYFDDADAGFHKKATVEFRLAGPAAGNYTVPDPVIVYADILPKTLNVVGTQVDPSKEYDGNVYIPVSFAGTLIGLISGDNVTLTAVASCGTYGAGNGKAVTIVYTLDGPDAGNYEAPLNGSASTSILPKNISIVGTDVVRKKGFDGTTDARINVRGTIDGKVGNDNVDYTAEARYDNMNVGIGKSITVTYTLVGDDAGNYNTPAPTVFDDGEITQVQPTVANTEIVASKEYDGTTNATVSYAGELVGTDPAHEVYVSATAVYDSEDASLNRNVIVTFTLYGKDANNYVTPEPIVLPGSITPKEVTAYGATLVPTRPYDGSTSITVNSNGSVLGVYSGDTVGVVATAVFRDKNVGTNKTADVTYTLTGPDAGNYVLANNMGTALSSVSRINLSVIGTDVRHSKNYDGNVDVQIINPGTITGLISGDDLVLDAQAHYDNKFVGTGKTITVNYTLAGNDAMNYVVPAQEVYTDGEITSFQPTVYDPQIVTTKVYDGTTVAQVTVPGKLDGVDSLLDVKLNATAQFSDKNVGSGMDVTITFTLTGKDANNFQTPDPVTLRGVGVITRKPVLATGATVVPTKTYDGLLDVAVVNNGYILPGYVVAGDVVNTAATAMFRDKNVGRNKDVDVTYSLVGADAFNYELQSNADFASATIIPTALTVTGTVVDTIKEYDGNTTARIITKGVPVLKVPSDVVTITASANYDSPFAGTGKTITINYTHHGPDSANYTTPTPNYLYNGVITANVPTVSGYDINTEKIYDGSTEAEVISSGTLDGIDPALDVHVIATANYDNPDAGTGKTVTITFTLVGADAGLFETPNPVTIPGGKIDQKTVFIANTSIASSKVYDGGITLDVINPGTIVGLEPDDDVTLVVTANFRDKIVGNSKPVDVTYSLTGDDKANYFLSVTADVKAASIVPASITVSGTLVAESKPYDGNANATVINPGTIEGLFNGDVVFLTTIAAFDNKNVGTGKVITASYTISGTDAQNYITPLPTYFNNGEIVENNTLTVSGYQVNGEKTYNGMTDAEVTLAGTLEGVPDGLDINLVTTAQYSDKNVGSNKDIILTFTLTGSDAANYQAPAPVTLKGQGKINAKNVTATGATLAATKPYDGTVSAIVTSNGTLTGVSPADSVAVVATATFRDKNVGNSKDVDIIYSIAGKDARNYTLTNTTGIGSSSIIQASLTVSGTDVARIKNYDGNTDARVVYSGVISGTYGDDQVILTSPLAYYDNKRIGTNKVITVTFGITGADAANYLNPAPVIFTDGEIRTNKPTVVDYPETFTKEYDGTWTAVVDNPGTLLGVDTSLDVTLTATVVYDDNNAGTSKNVTLVFSLTGPDAVNFEVPDPIVLPNAGIISKKPVTVTGATVAPSKVYDGNISLPVLNNGQVTGFVSPDSISVVATANFLTKDVEAQPKNVTINYTLAGPDKDNYVIANPVGFATAIITPAAITVTGTNPVPVKPYDGNSNAGIADDGTIVGKIGADQVSLVATATYDNPNVGTGKLITVNFTLAGQDAVNYANPTPLIFNNGEITKVKPTVADDYQIAVNKVYDGNNNAIVNFPGTLQNVGTADVTLSTLATFSDKNVGSRKDVTLTFTLNGNDAANFDTPDPIVLQQAGTITPKDVEGYGAYVALQKTYDGTKNITVLNHGSIRGLVLPDSVVTYVTASFRDKNVDTNKVVDLSYMLLGPDANNYHLTNSGDTAFSTIVPKNVTVSGTVVESIRAYDATTNCRIIAPGVVDSLCNGDNVNIMAFAQFNDKNVDTAKVITISYVLSGADANNYIVSAQTTMNDGAITPAKLTVSGLVIDPWKNYDGNVIATIIGSPTLIGQFPGDVLFLTPSADFDSPDAGNNKVITAKFSVFGTDRFNYDPIPDSIYTNDGIIFDIVTLLSDSITNKKLLSDNETYCGGDVATVLYTIDRGIPYEYRLEFSNAAKAAGFVDIDWTRVNGDITFNIPDSCDGGDYYATVQFRNEIQARDGLTNVDRDTIEFTVNLSNKYITDIFEDVVSIDNRENRFRSYQWYKDGDIIANANLPYYQDKGGLYGEYYVVVNLGEEDEAIICPKEFYHTAGQKTKSISAYPNPAESELNIQLTGFAEGTHKMMLVNAAGFVVMTENFDGDNYKINVSGLPSGTYTVFVDGESVKAIKK
ncbi:MAG: YDG domain-containing protein [Paludibacteraceae bacterium]|nr:YDG domain-containing protein [Paludibacteraceae bacterium]